MVDKHDLRGVHWELGNSKVNYESTTGEHFMSENRNQVVRSAIRARTEPESLQLGKLLRKSHIQLSHREDKKAAQTEAKMRYVPQKIEVVQSYADTNGADLKKSNIDLAVGQDKSGQGWTSVLKSSMSSGEEAKFACKKPEGFEMLGEELRKSSVLLHAGRHDFRSEKLPQHRSEAKNQFTTKPISPTVNFAATVGVALRTSSIDFDPGVPKTCTSWKSQQHAIMGDNGEKKWRPQRAEGFNHLIAELRKTNITLGSDKTVYGSEGLKRPVRDDRNANPAGNVASHC
jgi:hypothetical protein